MNRKENKIKVASAAPGMQKVLFIFLVLLLTLGFEQKGTAQCAGFIDSLAQFCLSSSSTKLFSNATASGGTINWISSGDGTFDNNTIERPTYTPGVRDSINGYAFIYLDVYVDHPVNYCSVLPFVTLYFNNMQAVATPASQTTCSGATIVPIITAANLRTPTYTWRRDNQFTVTGMPLSGTGGIRGALTNITTEPVTVTFTITPTTPTCTGTPITATVTVNPRVIATATPIAQTICSGSAIAPINLTSNIAGTTFSWTRDSLTAVSGIPASGTGNITGSLVNNTAAPVTVSFTITPTANGCAGTPVKATVTVNPATVVAAIAPASQTVCSGGAIVPLLLTSNTAGSTFNWTRNNTASVTGISETGNGDISGTLVNSTTAPVTVNIIATATANGCTSSPVNAMITVGPALLATATPPVQSVCSGAAIVPVILASNLGGTSFSWTRNNTVAATGIAASGTGNISGTLTNTSTQPVTVTFTITPAAQGCTGQEITATVVVNPLPSTTVAGSGQNVCSGAPINTVSFSSATPGAEFNWTRTNTAAITGIPASGSGNISGVLTTTSLSQLIVTFTARATAAGCTGASVPATIRVRPLPVATATPSSQTICSGSTISSIALTSNLAATTYSWSRTNTATVTGIAATGSGNIAGTLTSTAAARESVSFQVIPTAATCSGPAISATVLVDPRPGASISGDQLVCVGQPSGNISIALTGEGPWNFTYSDGTTPVSVTANSINPYTFIVNPAVAATYTVTALSTASCTALPASITGSATLTPLRYDINASAGPNGSISPVGTQAVDCSSSHTYNITPDPGFNVQEVLVNGISQGSITSYTFTNVSGNQTISASFSSGSNIITATADDDGAIVPAGSVQVGTGGSQTFSFVPNSCHEVEDVLVNGVSQGPLNSYTFTNVTAPHSINVLFKDSEYPITATAGNHGTISPAGITFVECGHDQTYTILPGESFSVMDVVVNGISMGPITSYTFTNVTAPQTISASFAPFSHIITAGSGGNGTISPAGSVFVADGSSQSFSFTADSCFQIADVLVNGISQGPIASYLFENVVSAQSIDVVFSPLNYSIVGTAGSNGAISPAGVTNVACGGSQTYVFTPDAGYGVQDVLVNGISQGAISSYTFTNVTAAQNISVVFAGGTYSITASADAGGSISPSGIVQVASGAGTTFAIIPLKCYEVADVLVNGKSEGPLTSYSFVNVTQAQTIHATFRLIQYSIAASAGANGTISPAGSTAVVCGGSASYTITPLPGFVISNVFVNGITQGAITGYLFENVSSSQSIEATFVAATTTISATSGANGVISPAGDITIPNGGSQSFTFTADNCYEVADVLVNGVSQGAVNSYSFNNVNAPQTISVSFVQTAYHIVASAGLNGTITPEGTTSVLCGSNQTYSIVASQGFAVQDVVVDGVGQGPIASYSFTNITAPHTISATFTAVSACATPSLQANVTNVACRNAATGAITLTTTGGTAPFSYSWSGTGGFTANTKDVANLVAGTYTVQVTANGGCFTSATYTITQPATVLTTGSTQGTITCNGGTTTVNITATGGVLPYTGTGALTNQLAGVNIYPVTDAAGCTVNRTVTLTQPTPIVASISANAIACSGGTTILRVTATGGTGIRQFSLNGGPFQTITTFTVNAAGSPYTVTVRDANLCSVVTNTLTVTNPSISTVPARPAVVTGPVYGLCGGGIFTYTVQPVPNATSYTWQAPAGGTIVSGQGTAEVQVSVPATFTTSSAIGVSAINGCGTSTQYRFSIFAVLYYAPAAINGPTAVTTNQAGVQYSVPSTPGTTYNWTVPFGAAITSGQGTNVVTVRFGSTSGNIGLDVINACGTAPRALKAITVAAPRPGGIAARAAIAPPQAQLNIYPNPAMHNTTVQFNTNKAGGKYEITITSATDKTILAQSGISKTGLNTLQFDLRRLNRGIYMVRLVTDGYSETKKIFKQ